MVAGISAFAQNRELSGVVLDATDAPLIGVAVIVDGTTNGAMTAEDGSFMLTVPAADVVLNVSSLGYVTKLVTVPANQQFFITTSVLLFSSANAIPIKPPTRAFEATTIASL